MDDDIVRICIATDCHLGFQERDPIRGDDSFAAFEEVLVQARRKKSDLVLIAGDMFHENKPSRRTMHIAMDLLRKHCLGDRPVFTEVLNADRQVFKNRLGRVNYEDPFQSICLPVFAIHGNHDDPSREGGQGEPLAALDLLSVVNLINYFGKTEQVDAIEITPIILRKGSTKVAIYGLGAVRDERLNRMWNDKKVRFVRPDDEEKRADMLNIFVLHQNRDYGRGRKNCIHESMIPEWMDVVIWGNEHECKPELVESLVGTFRIYQPGSSVACSLVEGESAKYPKNIGFLDVRGKKFRLRPEPYTQVRPFLYGELSLEKEPSLNKSDSNLEAKIKAVLAQRVMEMLAEAREAAPAVEEGALTFNLEHKVRDPKRALIRLKVDHSGFTAINSQRFGSQFAGEVANPADILIFSRKKKEGLRMVEPGGQRQRISAQAELNQLIEEGEEEAIHKIKIEDLVTETLQLGHRNLSLLTVEDMAEALDDFVASKNVGAIQEAVQTTLERTQASLIKGGVTADAVSILEATTKEREKSSSKKGKEQKKWAVKRPHPGAEEDEDGFQDLAGGNIDGSDEDGDEEPVRKKAARGKGASVGATMKPKAKAKSPAKSRASAKNARTAAAPKAGRGGSRASKQKKDEDEDEYDDDDDDDNKADSDNDDDEEEDRAPASRKAGASGARAASASSSSSSRQTSRRAAASKPKKYADPDSEEMEDVEEANSADDEVVQPRARRGPPLPRVDYDEEDEEEEERDSVRGRTDRHHSNVPLRASLSPDGTEYEGGVAPTATSARSGALGLALSAASSYAESREPTSQAQSATGRKRTLPLTFGSRAKA